MHQQCALKPCTKCYLKKNSSRTAKIEHTEDIPASYFVRAGHRQRRIASARFPTQDACQKLRTMVSYTFQSTRTSLSSRIDQRPILYADKVPMVCQFTPGRKGSCASPSTHFAPVRCMSRGTTFTSPGDVATSIFAFCKYQHNLHSKDVQDDVRRKGYFVGVTLSVVVCISLCTLRIGGNRISRKKN